MNLSIIYIYIYFLDILQLESFPFLIYHLLFLHYFNKKKRIVRFIVQIYVPEKTKITILVTV